MGLIYRTSSIANAGTSSIKNAALTYAEGDGNIAFLLTNLSGSNVSISGNTEMSGPVQVNGNIQMDGIVYMPELTSTSQTNTLTYDSSTGRVYYTASSAIIGNLQQTLDAGSSSLNNNILLKYNPGLDVAEIELDVLSGRIKVENLILGYKTELNSLSQVFTNTDRTTTVQTQASPTSGSNTLILPEANGTFTLSVNGIGADASGSITIPTGSATNPGGSNTQIQFNSSSQFGATSSFKFDYTKQVLNHGYEVNNLISGGFYSHAQGKDTYSTGDYSHAEGLGTYANSPYSHTEGRFTWVYGTASHAEGNNTKVGTRFAWSGSARFSYVTMSSEYSNITSSFNIGDRLYLYRSIGGFGLVDVAKIVTESVYDPISDTTILGLDSSVGSTRLSLFVGNTQTSPGFWGGGGSYIVPLNYSHTEGNNADALNEASHAEGDSTVAYGYASHAEGSGTKTIGNYSHAEGSNTIAIGLGSHAAGLGTVTNGNYQSAIGQYNISSSAQSAFVIGNGSNNSNRSNLLFASGSQVQITGSLDVSGSARITDVLTMPFHNPLPSNRPTGSVALSGSGGTFEGMYVYNGTSWINVKA